MSARYLSQQELKTLQEKATYGDLDHTTLSKRHVRILLSLHFVLSTNKDMISLPYASLSVIINLIERFFGKLYTPEELLYWVEDLTKRDYICLHHTKQCFVLTERGKELLERVSEIRESLFESNSKNSIAFLN